MIVSDVQDEVEVERNLIQSGFDLHLEMTLEQVIEALKFCPVSYDIKQVENQYFFFKVDEVEHKMIILNFLNDHKLRKELGENICQKQKIMVDAIIKASISK